MGIPHLGILALGLVLGSGLACQSRTKPMTTDGFLDGAEAHPEMAMQKMKIEAFGLDGKEWELMSPFADGGKIKQILNVREPRITFFENGRKSTDLTADHGYIRFEETPKSAPRVSTGPPINEMGGQGPGYMFLSGHVVAISTDGSKMFTDWLRYDDSNGLITSTAPVKIVRDDSISDGVGFEATADFSHVKIFNQTVKIKEKLIKKR